MIKKTRLNMQGNEQQTLALMLAIAPSVQGDTFNVTPSTGFPSGAKSTESSPVASKNPYYIHVETAIT